MTSEIQLSESSRRVEAPLWAQSKAAPIRDFASFTVESESELKYWWLRRGQLSPSSGNIALCRLLDGCQPGGFGETDPHTAASRPLRSELK